MAEYFTARGLPVPRELRQNPLTDWRRLTLIAAALIVFVIGLRVTNLDLSRANPEYSAQLLRQLFQWDLTILTPPCRRSSPSSSRFPSASWGRETS